MPRNKKRYNKHAYRKFSYSSYSKGKHSKPCILLMINKKIINQILLLLLISIIGTSIAYLVKVNILSNDFILGKVEAEIIENFDAKNKIKKNVFVKNTGNVPIYIRSTVVICWKDMDDKVLPEYPEENIDYTIKFSDSSNWLKSNDGYYYYKYSIEPNSITETLIEECKQIKEYDDRILEVTIANQAIQAIPDNAVKEAWNVEIKDNTLVLKE